MTAWIATPPTPEQLQQHALAHTSERFNDGRIAGLWLLRPKPLPKGWSQMTPMQRHRTGALKARKLGSYPTVVQVGESARTPGDWGVYQPDSHTSYTLADLSAYEWCPLTSRGDVAPLPIDREPKES